MAYSNNVHMTIALIFSTRMQMIVLKLPDYYSEIIYSSYILHLQDFLLNIFFYSFFLQRYSRVIINFKMHSGL